MKILRLVVPGLLLISCASPPKQIPPAEMPLSTEFDITVPSGCQDHPEPFRVKKTADVACPYFDGHQVCWIQWRSVKSAKMRKTMLSPTAPVRFGFFTETKRMDTFTGVGGTENRETCDLEFDLETGGKTQRCAYNRHLKDIDIFCP